MSIVITGGTGFIGLQLARILIEKGEEPVLFHFNPQKEELVKDIKDRVKMVRGDLANFSHVLNLVCDSKADTIYHLGGMLSVPSENDPWKSFRTNAEGTFHILEAARLFGVNKVIFSSTVETYGADIRSDIIDDQTIQRPLLMYGCTKLFAELLGRFYARKFGLDFRAVRFPSIVGPGVRTPGIVQYNAWAIEEAFYGRPFEIWVSPDDARPVMYYKDAAASLVQLCKAPRENIKTMIYNLGAELVKAGDLVKIIKKFIPDAKISFKEDPELVKIIRESGKRQIDDSRAREEWGWRARYNLEEMVRDFIEELRKNPELYDRKREPR